MPMEFKTGKEFARTGQPHLCKRLEKLCNASCGNWPATTADECTFCPYRNKRKGTK